MNVCTAVESGGYQCERLDPHGDDGHWISDETIRTRLAHPPRELTPEEAPNG